jgi:hypothetical protein
MSDNQRSSIKIKADGLMVFAGPDAVRLYQAELICEALHQLKLGRSLNRAYTRANTLAAAGRITGQTYKWSAVDRAIADIRSWIDATRSTIDIVTE